MFAKHITASVIGSALLATAAFAQSPSTDTKTTPPTTPPAASSTTTPATPPAASTAEKSTSEKSTSASTSYTGNWRASKVVGLSVYNDANESLGSINDLLTDKNGKIVAAVIGVGGFLGVGERYVAIPFEKVKFVNEPVKSNTASSGAAPAGGAATGARPGATTGAAGGSMSSTPAATASTPNPWYPDHAVISGTKDELKSMAEFKYTN